jgi:hypothetical protein
VAAEVRRAQQVGGGSVEVVTADWLLECARLRCKVQLEPK